MSPSRWQATIAVLLFLGIVPAPAGNRSGGPYGVTDDPVSTAAGVGTAAIYRADHGTGDLAGRSSDSAGTVARHGYAGTLADASVVLLHADTNAMGEGETRQMTAVAVMDDATETVLAGAESVWTVDGPPLSGVTTGLVKAGSVYVAATGTVRAAWLEASGFASLVVRDSDPDNWGAYAHDGLADGWQVLHFGSDNPLAGPDGDGDHDTQNNLHEYVAGTDPTNIASRFQLGVIPVAGKPDWMIVWFDPCFDDRDYTVLSKASLSSPSWTNETEQIVDAGTVGALTDTNVVGSAKFYRVRIGFPASGP